MRLMTTEQSGSENGNGGAQGGVLVLVVGPSGAGKDSLLEGVREALAQDDRFWFPTRVITRPEGPGENHEPATQAEFAAHLSAGNFFLTWEAHGLQYGLPAEIGTALAAGHVVVVNASRSVVDAARAIWSDVRVVHVTTAADELYRRLRARGRETDDEIIGRVARATRFSVAELGRVDTIDNSGTIEDGVARLQRLLEGYDPLSSRIPDNGMRAIR